MLTLRYVKTNTTVSTHVVKLIIKELVNECHQKTYTGILHAA